MAEPAQGSRRRVGALLNAYYRIEGAEKIEPEVTQVSDLDRQGFDAKRYFDGMVARGKLGDLVENARTLDAEVQDLDGDMQKLVYENYSKFIRATDVIKQMKFTIDGLEPDIRKLDGHLGKINSAQSRVEDGVALRSGQIDTLLKQQKNCSKLQVLFGLPATLRVCLDRGAYGRAVEAYCCCTPFLRQYKDLPTFNKVLEDVELQMGCIRNALEERLRSPDLSVDEAVNSSMTLLDLGDDSAKVTGEYLVGRAEVLRRSLDHCFTTNEAFESPAASSTEGEVVELSRDQQELQRPESILLHGACSKAAESYVPHLCDAVEGFQKLQEGRTLAAGGSIDESVLEKFVHARVEELCERISDLIGRRLPPTRVLVSCVHFVRDSLRRLHAVMPKLLTRLFAAFLNRTATSAMKALFERASSSLVTELCGLHSKCKGLQESSDSGVDDVLDEIAKTEQAIIMSGFAALSDCQPLLSLLGSDRQAGLLLVRGLHSQLITLFLTFVEVSYVYIGREPYEARSLDPSPPAVDRVAKKEIAEAGKLEWIGLFGLALVRIGRHFEVKAVDKVWSVAKDLFESALCGTDATSELATSSAVVRATRAAAQAVITYYALVSGQRLAHFFRNSVQNRNWMTVREPREPRLVVEMVLKEVHAFDVQLARILGDPRKPRDAREQRRVLSHFKHDMELRKIERQHAKKKEMYAPVPFNRNGAMVAILRIAFKALYEYIREETFAKFGLQQIQVDCAFLEDAARDFVEQEDANLLDSLLDEVVTSASQRCDDPVLMDASIAEALCDEKKKKGLKLDT